MKSGDLPRRLMEAIPGVSRGYPVLCITGPRQSGKTTLAQQAFTDRPYRSCKDAAVLMRAVADPVGFLSELPDGAVLDEVQRVPTLIEHLQVVVDAQRRMGRWVLTGSQNLTLLRTVSESLAGRVAYLHLLPFARDELTPSPRLPKTLAQAVLIGGYPPIFDPLREVDPWRWLSDYLDTYVQRDVLALLQVRNRAAFLRFLQLCARNVGCLTNAQAWGGEIGVDSKTIAGWLSVLQTTFVIALVQPSTHAFGKRMTKHPKLYFYDTGLACALLGLTDVHQVAGHPQWGSLVENWCYTEVLKARWHRGLPAQIEHWRSSDGYEVDLMLTTGAGPVPIEIKASQTPDPSMASGLRAVRAQAQAKQGRLASGLVIYGGERDQPLHDDRFVSWQHIDAAIAGLPI